MRTARAVWVVLAAAGIWSADPASGQSRDTAVEQEQQPGVGGITDPALPPDVEPQDPRAESDGVDGFGAAAGRRVFVALTAEAEHTFRTEFDDDAGSLEYTAVRQNLGIAVPINRRVAYLFDIDTTQQFFNFDGLDDLLPGSGGASPVDDVYSVGFSTGFRVQQTPRFSWVALGTVSFAGENDAEFSDGISGGVVAIVNYKVNDRLTVGGGIALQSDLVDDGVNIVGFPGLRGVSLFPFPGVRYQINDRWRVGTDRSIFLAYRASERFEARADVEFFNEQFRLGNDGPLPDGAVSYRRVQLSLRGDYTVGRRLSAFGRVGIALAQELEFQTDGGDDVSEPELDPGLVLGGGITIRF